MRQQPRSAIRALLIVLAAHSPASTASSMLARQSRTAATPILVICSSPKYGSSRSVPWARTCLPRALGHLALGVAQIARPVGLEALAADHHPAAGQLGLPL